MPTAKAASTNGTGTKEEVQEVKAALPPMRPNLVRPVPIVLDFEHEDDETFYQLRMSNLAMELIEESIGLSLWRGLDNIEGLKPVHVATMVWACLKWQHPELTLEQVRQLPGMDISNLVYVITKLQDVIYGHLPEPPKEGEQSEDADPNPNPSVGSTSGQSEQSI